MSKVFFPESFLMIEASCPPHPAHTQYKVSIGKEDWGNGVFETVIKVQMVYDGVVAGRRSPSFPLNTDDYQRVTAAINQLLAQRHQ